LLGYGDFVVESAGQDQALRTIDHIPYPEELYQRVCERIFPDASAAAKPKEPENATARVDMTIESGSAEMLESESGELIESGSAEMLEPDPEDTHVLDATELDEL